MALWPLWRLAALPPDRLLPSPATPPILLDHAEVAAKPALPLLRLGREGSQPFEDRGLGDRALVLCWHSFLGNPAYPTDFSLHEFASQLDAIAALGYRFVTVEELLAGKVEGALNVVVTIDDGHRSVPDAIAKVLGPRGIVPTLFVYPAVLGTTAFSMSDIELARLAAKGIPVGAHGYHHLYVNEALFKSDPQAFEEEIRRAKSGTERLSGHFVTAYAYPFGAYSPRTQAEVRLSGYAAAFAVKPGFVFARPGLNDAWALPRLVVTREAWKDILGLLERNAGQGPDPR